MQAEKRKAMSDLQGNPSRPVSASEFTQEETYRASRLPVDRASTLIPDAYTSPEFHALELDRIFGTSCRCMRHGRGRRAGELRRRRRRRTLADRLPKPLWRAACPPRLSPRNEACETEHGTVERFFQCPYHARACDLDGVLLGTPLFTPEAGIPADQEDAFDMSGVHAFDKADYGLHPASVDSWGCLVFVCLDPKAPPLLDEPATCRRGWPATASRSTRCSGGSSIRSGPTGSSSARTSWSTTTCRGFIRGSSRCLRSSRTTAGRGPGCTWGSAPLRSQPTRTTGWLGLPALSTLSEEDRESARFAWLFPNLALNALPNHTFLMLARPTEAGRTEETTYLLSHPESIAGAGDRLEDEVETLIRFWDEVNREDIGIVERVQQGVADTAYTGGRMCYRFEESVHRFQNMVIDRMVGVRRVPVGDAKSGLQPMFPSR